MGCEKKARIVAAKQPAGKTNGKSEAMRFPVAILSDILMGVISQIIFSSEMRKMVKISCRTDLRLISSTEFVLQQI